MKIKAGGVYKVDSIMADKGFDIESELRELGLELTIPKFLKDIFQIFHSVIPSAMFGSVNQVWTVACLLSNFQAPILV